jgi:hypothetical protein
VSSRRDRRHSSQRFGFTPCARRRRAQQLVHLDAERGSPKYKKAALRWLERYLTEGSPKLKHFAEITASLAARECD